MRRTAPLLVVALAPLVACSGDDDAASTTTTLAVAGEIDIELQESVELPPEFPDVPIPAEVLIENAETLTGETSELYEVTGWFDGDPIRAARDYLAVLDDRGYEVTSRTEAPDSLFFIADDGTWFVSAGFFPDPIRNVGTSVGLTVGPASSSG